MNHLAPMLASLPDMVRRASGQLETAITAAEVLEIRDEASSAYDQIKRETRLAKAKGAHDELIAKAHYAQADILEIEAAAKRRLADEYDAAQERGEVATARDGNIGRSTGERPATAADIGLTRKDVHEARQIRDAEVAQPGIVRQILDQRLSDGQEPNRAALRAAVIEAAKQGLRGGPTPSRKNPSYEPDPQWDVMVAVSGGCRDMMDKVRGKSPAYIIGGFVDDGMRRRNLSSIRECRDFLSTILEFADA